MLRDKFPQYARPTDDELAELFENGIIALDASSLLNLYRYSEATREDFLKAYEDEKIRLRLWMPYQVAAEFMENRPAVLLEKFNDVKTLRQAIQKYVNEAVKQAKEALQKVGRHSSEHPHIDIAGLSKNLEEQIPGVLEQILEQFLSDSDSPAPSQDLESDPLFARIEELFGTQIGKGFESKTLEQIKKDGEIRYQREIPPGYKDLGQKPDPYGDLIIWKELIERAKSQKKGIVFVTDDAKEDWVNKQGQKKLGPRLELVKEMFDEAGQQFHSYDSPQFHRYAKKLLEEKPRPESIQEAEEINDFLSELESESRSRNSMYSAVLGSNFDVLRQSIGSHFSSDLASAYTDPILGSNKALLDQIKLASGELYSPLSDNLGLQRAATGLMPSTVFGLLGQQGDALKVLQEQMGISNQENLAKGIREQLGLGEIVGGSKALQTAIDEMNLGLTPPKGIGSSVYDESEEDGDEAE